MIEVRGVVKSFGAVQALAGVDFTVHRGETFGLLGPNGAGKTTTMAMLAGLLRPDRGEVWIDGRRDPTSPSVRACLGIAPQELAIYEELSAEENLRFFGRLHGWCGRALAARVDEGLAFAGLEARRRDRAGTFSGGMKRRLNLACALVHDPAVLLCDEPTVGVDPQSRQHILDGIQRLRHRGLTLVYTTHHLEEAAQLCDRVAIVDGGRLLALDTVAELVRRHGDAGAQAAGNGAAGGDAGLHGVFLRLTGRELRDP
jgi:ABC-2 type transport system ATP-binding protein